MGNQRFDFDHPALDHRNACLERAIDGEAADDRQVFVEHLIEHVRDLCAARSHTKNSQRSTRAQIIERTFKHLRDARSVYDEFETV
jgi:hypothetical protein